MARTRRLRRLKQYFAGLRSPARSAGGPRRTLQATLNLDAYERHFAELAQADYPNQTLDSVAMHAYQQAYPNAPEFPDFYDDDQLDTIYAWVRIRNWVDWARNRPGEGPAIAVGVPPYSDPRPLNSLGVPMAVGDPNPIWPVISTDPRGCDVNYLDVNGVSHGLMFQRFGAPRGSSDWFNVPSRYHIGHDCIAVAGDIVVAPEDGVVGNIRNFYAGTKAMYLWTDTGITINLGEIEPGSQRDFGATEGTRVSKGQPVARVGEFEMGKELPYNMIHFEIFDGHRDRSLNWYDGEPRPTDLRNPTDYLLRARCGETTTVTGPQQFQATPPAPQMGFAAEASEPLTEAQLIELGTLVMADPDPGFPH
ncbi:MAG: M23 family metallopeptidase [Gammaproteobacteria bacterium]|nr:M23 family metallopeptidase [Gammaproteobacteria bacterium]